MYIVFYSVVLNHHQAPVADALWNLCKGHYTFVELKPLADSKGAIADYSQRPYLLRAWESMEAYTKAMALAKTADVCVFSGIDALPFEKERLKLGLLSFDMSERWLKRGLLNLFSPAIFKMFLAYYLGGWKHKPLYKLCCSAFAAGDHRKLGMYRGRCFKWGYFTRVEKIDVEASRDVSTSNAEATPLMWCARYLMLKHPELPLLMAARLKADGYRFTLDMYGSGEYENEIRQLSKKLCIEDVVHFLGNMPNEKLLVEMRKHSIFLFTSDRNEGWGVVANESMANGCALVASDAIGCVLYLVKNGHTGLLFRRPKTASNIHRPDNDALDDLCKKVMFLLDNPLRLQTIRYESSILMQKVWNNNIAAERFLTLVNCIQQGTEPNFEDGPCSKA